MASTSQPVGQTVSHYRLLRRIGGGGMSILLILVVLTVVSVGSEAACPCAAAPCSAAEKALQIVYGQKIRDGIGRSHESRYALCDSHSCRGRIHHHASHASRRREHRRGERKLGSRHGRPFQPWHSRTHGGRRLRIRIQENGTLRLVKNRHHYPSAWNRPLYDTMARAWVRAHR